MDLGATRVRIKNLFCKSNWQLCPTINITIDLQNLPLQIAAKLVARIQGFLHILSKATML